MNNKLRKEDQGNENSEEIISEFENILADIDKLKSDIPNKSSNNINFEKLYSSSKHLFDDEKVVLNDDKTPIERKTFQDKNRKENQLKTEKKNKIIDNNEYEAKLPINKEASITSTIDNKSINNEISSRTNRNKEVVTSSNINDEPNKEVIIKSSINSEKDDLNRNVLKDSFEDIIIKDKIDEAEPEKILAENNDISEDIIKPKSNHDDTEEFIKIIKKKESPVVIHTYDTKEKIKSKKHHKKKKIILGLIVIIILAAIAFGIYSTINYFTNKQTEHKQQETLSSIKEHYSSHVITNKEINLYKKNDKKYIEAGLIGKGQELTIEEMNLDYNSKYFKLKDFDDYYVYYDNVSPIKELSKTNTRYKNYLLYNTSIITKDSVTFYDEDNTMVYKINETMTLPIIINKDNFYGVEYNSKLLYVKNNDIKEKKAIKNSDKSNTPSIAVLNYHFSYDESKASERADCNQIICQSKSQITSHLEYIKNNNIFTPNMKEFEMYIDKQINLPKSVLITIDDGWRTDIMVSLLEKYKLNGTIFLITSWFKEIDFLDKYEYIEYHSHGDNLHNQGICPGGQGGAIKCLEETKLLADLKLSREKLGNTTTFCYPFYEYNDYSIKMLKQVGFTMAFVGGDKKAVPGNDKFSIPRYVIISSTDNNDLKNYIG